jgi:hypothetical protein
LLDPTGLAATIAPAPLTVQASADGSALPAWLQFDAIHLRVVGLWPAGLARFEAELTAVDPTGQQARTVLTLLRP